MSRAPDFSTDEGEAQFWITDEYEGGITWIGKFSGESPWEKHPGDEFLYMVEGDVQIELLSEPEPRTINLSAGMSFVVPKHVWHRQKAAASVVQIGATPGQTEHSTAEDPRLVD